jgi:hypothetical protein
MGVLRFPNPGSDLLRFISTFSSIYNELKGKNNFTHDDTRDAAIKHGLVSSSGAIGAEAVKRSVRNNRALDPLYNQLKMYSELYRILGWLKPGTKNTNFNFTELSPYVAEANSSVQMRIFEECLLSIVFPNPLLENRSGNNVRPFPLILRLAQVLNGVIFRDEIIISIFPLQNDKPQDTLAKLVAQIKNIRGDSKKLFIAKNKLSRETKIMETTLENYTRFPLGSIKGVNWFQSGSVRSAYDKSMQGYSLTEVGTERANQMNNLIDVRHEDIGKFDLASRSAFTLLMHYIFLERCGFDILPFEQMLDDLKEKIQPILTKLNVSFPRQIFYSPTQQSTSEELKNAAILEENYQ